MSTLYERQHTPTDQSDTDEADLSFVGRLNIIRQFAFERFQIFFQTKNFSELLDGIKLIGKYINDSFSLKEKFISILTVMFLLFFGLFSFEFFTNGQIDEAIQNHQFAKAQKLINGRLKLFPNSADLQLRLAHTYLALGQKEEAKKIVVGHQETSSNNKYLPIVALELARVFKRENKAFDAINVIEKVPHNFCPECLQELLSLYSKEGKHSIANKNYERGAHYLFQSLKLSIKLKDSPKTIDSKKQDLVKAYKLYAEQLIKEKKQSKAIEVLEQANRISESGQAYKLLGQLYAELKKDSEGTRLSLSSYKTAYEMGLTEVYDAHFNLIQQYKVSLKKDGISSKEIKKRVNALTIEKAKRKTQKSKVKKTSLPTISWGKQKSKAKTTLSDQKKLQTKKKVFQSPY